MRCEGKTKGRKQREREEGESKEKRSSKTKEKEKEKGKKKAFEGFFLYRSIGRKQKGKKKRHQTHLFLSIASLDGSSSKKEALGTRATLLVRRASRRPREQETRGIEVDDVDVDVDGVVVEQFALDAPLLAAPPPLALATAIGNPGTNAEIIVG